jgi:hypothetical protein
MVRLHTLRQSMWVILSDFASENNMNSPGDDLVESFVPSQGPATDAGKTYFSIAADSIAADSIAANSRAPKVHLNSYVQFPHSLSRSRVFSWKPISGVSSQELLCFPRL